MATDSKHVVCSRTLASIFSHLKAVTTTADILMENYKRDNYSTTSMIPNMLMQHASQCAAAYAEIARIAGEIHRDQMAVLLPQAVVAAASPPPPDNRPQKAAHPPVVDPIIQTEDEIAAKPAPEPVAAPAPVAAPKSNWDSSRIIETAPKQAAAATPTEQFRHDPKVVEAPAGAGVLVNIGNGIMVNVPRAPAPVPGYIVMLAPHHFVVPIPGLGGKTHFIHTTGMGRSHQSLPMYIQVFNPSLGRTRDGFFVNPFGSGGSGTGSKIVRNMPAMIFLGAPDASTQELLIRQRITYTTLPFNLRGPDEFKASLARMDEHNLENLKQVVAFLNMLYAVAS